MFLESFHRTLKVVNLNHKKNRRIDILLITLVKVARNKAFEQFKKQECGKVTHRISEIMKRHKAATNLSPNLITEIIPDKEWKVTSASERNEQYRVVKHDESNKCSCKILCRVCCICPHTYTCECMDALVHATVCKHQHLIHINLNPNIANTSDTMDDGQMTNVNYNYYNKILFNQESRSAFNNKQMALIQLEELRREIEKSDRDDIIQITSRHIQARIAVFRTLSYCNEIALVPKRKIAPNENNEKQMQFHSTKKKRKITASVISKPSVSESTDVKQVLLNTEPIFCGKCMAENDKCSENSTIEWINCDICSVWLHLSCTTPKLTMIPNYYECEFCRMHY